MVRSGPHAPANVSVTPHDTPLRPLVEYLHATRFEDLPAPVRERAVDILLDTVGCVLGGTRTEVGAVQARVLGRLAGAGRSTVPGLRAGLDPLSAAFLNASLSDALDYEDTLLGFGHPSASIVPAALAVGEHVDASGPEVLTAIVVGYDVGVRIARAVLPSVERRREVNVRYAWKAFGAVAAASRLLRLSRDATLDAFGYAGAASPLPTWLTKWGRPLHWLKNNFGEQTRAGVLGALMAEEGFRGPRNILDNDLGFWRMVGSDRYDAAELTRELGTRYEILDTQLKPYPACRWLHTTIEAASALRARGEFSVEDVQEVIVRSFPEMTRWFDDPAPATLVDAEFSVPYAVAMALLGLPAGPDWYAARTLGDPRALDLARRVRLEESEGADAAYWRGLLPTEVTVRTASGGRLTESMAVPLGSVERPLTSGQIEAKFVSLADSVLGSGGASLAWTQGRRVPSLPSIREWVAVLIPGQADRRR